MPIQVSTAAYFEKKKKYARQEFFNVKLLYNSIFIIIATHPMSTTLTTISSTTSATTLVTTLDNDNPSKYMLA